MLRNLNFIRGTKSCVCDDYRLLVPFPSEEYEERVHHQEDICQDQQVMGVPEGIETGKVMQRRWQLHHTPPEGVRCQREREGHDNDHEDASDTRGARQ